MGQTLNMPTLGILFDVDKIEKHDDSGNYLIGAWKLIWGTVGINSLKDWNGVLLYECDTDGDIYGCCLVIQSMDTSLLRNIRDALSKSIEYQKVADPPMFIEGEIARAQPLMAAGTIDSGGNVIGNNSYCPSSALEAIRERL